MVVSRRLRLNVGSLTLQTGRILCDGILKVVETLQHVLAIEFSDNIALFDIDPAVATSRRTRLKSSSPPPPPEYSCDEVEPRPEDPIALPLELEEEDEELELPLVADAPAEVLELELEVEEPVVPAVPPPDWLPRETPRRH